MIRTMLRVRARQGCEGAVESAWRQVAGQIGALPGNLLRALLLDAQDPRAFVVVTEWVDEAALRAYEDGPVAARFAATVGPYRESATVAGYRVMRGVRGHGSRIFVDVQITVPADRLAEFDRGYPEVVARMAGVPGYLREELLREPGSDVYHIFAEWSSEAEFRRWIGNPRHAQEEAGPIAQFLRTDFRRRLFFPATHADDRPTAGAGRSHSLFGGAT